MMLVTDQMTGSTVRPESALETTLRGSVLVLIQFDVCEEIRLDKLKEIVGTRPLEQISFKHQAPGYVRYQRPPVVEPIAPVVLETGESLRGAIKYYAYGVMRVEFGRPVSGGLDKLVKLVSG